MKSFLTLVVLLFAGSMGLKAQNVLFFDSRKGLSNSCIKNIYEDSRHNLWITTLNGLNCYDGAKMKTYRHEVGNPTSLLQDECTCVLECDSNTMLVGTGLGMQTFDALTERFTYLPYLDENGDTIKPRVGSFARIEGGSRFVACMAGYGHCYIEKDNKGAWVVTPTSDFLTENGTSTPAQLFEDDEQRLWVVNDQRSIYRKIGKNFKKYPEVSNVLKICTSVSKKIYVATFSDGIYLYNKDADRFDQVATGAEVGGFVSGFSPWTLGRMFISTDGNGVRVFDENTGKVIQSTLNVSDFDFATSNVKDAIGDSFGNVWIGIYWKGILMKPANNSPFEYIGRKSITKNTIGLNAVLALALNDDGRVWVGTEKDGLYLMAPDGSASQHWDWRTNPGMPHAFSYIQHVAPSTLLLATYGEGLWLMKNGTFSQLSREITHIFDIHPAEENGCYWIATLGGGFYYYNLATKQSIQYTADWSHGEEGTRIIGTQYATSIMQVENNLYVGGSDGLYICEVESGGVIKKSSKKVLENRTVRHMALSEDSTILWVGTNEGFAELNRKTLEIRIYTEKDGLPNNNVAGLGVADGKLWISTDYGLAFMDSETGRFNSFYSDDGLQDNEFSREAVLVNNGRIYFGGIGGMTYVDTKVMAQWEEGLVKPLHLKLLDVYVNGKAAHCGDMSGGYMILQDLLERCERVDLDYTDNHFTLELCVEGMNSQRVEYEYSVNDGPWTNQVLNNGMIVFENLSPGTYHIRLRALTLGFVGEERELTVVVHPAWYNSWWARLIYVLLFLGLCWIVWMMIRRGRENDKAEEFRYRRKEINEAKVQILMDFCSEIRVPLTSMLASVGKLLSLHKDEESQQNGKAMQQNVSRVLGLMDQVADVKRVEQGKSSLDYQKVELVAFLQGIFDLFVAQAKKHNIDYQFVHNVDEYFVFIDGEKMEKVVMNLLFNAFRYSADGGEIKLELAGLQRRFTLSVTDRGVGFSEDEKRLAFERYYSSKHQRGNIGTRIRLNLASLLVKQHEGTIEVADNPAGQGSIFTVNMPVGDMSLCLYK